MVSASRLRYAGIAGRPRQQPLQDRLGLPQSLEAPVGLAALALGDAQLLVALGQADADRTPRRASLP